MKAQKPKVFNLWTNITRIPKWKKISNQKVRNWLCKMMFYQQILKETKWRLSTKRVRKK